jgi:hypothetical protein
VWNDLQEHASLGEMPWFVIGGRAYGVLAAFEDRCMIVKSGGLTSMMAGSFGAGRITTFPFTEITGIEYNGGILNGVLEVLTPSYQGTANKDFWRGVNGARNSDSNDPRTLSNCLPLDRTTYKAALPYLNEIRKKMSAAKRPIVVMEPLAAQARPAPQAGDLADELTKLAALREKGFLDDAGFQAAKQAALARYTDS